MDINTHTYIHKRYPLKCQQKFMGNGIILTSNLKTKHLLKTTLSYDLMPSN